MGKGAVLVTGASRGIGSSIAINLARDGFDIGVNYKTYKSGADEVKKTIEELGQAAICIQADIGSAAQVEYMVNKFTNEFDSISGLVNNAGVYNRISFEELTLREWENTIKTNLTSVYLVTHTLLPHIQSGGRIINITSVLAHMGSNFGAHYATTKAGLIGFTKSLARELGVKGILVNAVAPGAIETQIIAGDTPEKRRERERITTVGRVGQPDEIAAVVSFLFSERASYINGETINVNGGLWMI
jgi:3-oxoacyl-[acyl-carrier protein] reductase